MNFANMNPAERLKASGLIGLIVVVLFFVVHTMLGAVSPKSAAQPADPPPGQPPGSTVQPGNPPPAGTPRDPSTAFIESPDKTAHTDITDASLLKSKEVIDPFVPLAKTPVDGVAAKPIATAQKPTLDVHPIQQTQPLPFPGSRNNFPPAFGGPGQSPGLNAAPAGPEPEIRVIGVVNGEESVATLDVAGRVRIFRPGEALAKGYRLDGVDEEGVRLRHDNKTVFVRVGAGINESITGRPGS